MACSHTHTTQELLKLTLSSCGRHCALTYSEILLCLTIVFNLMYLGHYHTQCVCLCVPYAVQYRVWRCSERPPRQHVAGYGQTVQGNPGGWSLAVVKAVSLVAFVKLALSCSGVFGVRHVVLHSPPPVLVLQTDSSPYLLLSVRPLFKHSLAKHFFSQNVSLSILVFSVSEGIFTSQHSSQKIIFVAFCY